jgi:hypothetical protein
MCLKAFSCYTDGNLPQICEQTKEDGTSKDSIDVYQLHIFRRSFICKWHCPQYQSPYHCYRYPLRTLMLPEYERAHVFDTKQAGRGKAAMSKRAMSNEMHPTAPTD